MGFRAKAQGRKDAKAGIMCVEPREFHMGYSETRLQSGRWTAAFAATICFETSSNKRHDPQAMTAFRDDEPWRIKGFMRSLPKSIAACLGDPTELQAEVRCNPPPVSIRTRDQVAYQWGVFMVVALIAAFVLAATDITLHPPISDCLYTSPDGFSTEGYSSVISGSN
jgi:hypothetical protein